MLKQAVESRIMSLSIPLRSLGIRRLGLLGSTARGDAQPDSDVDLLIEFVEGRKNFDAYNRDVADLLEAGFPVHVDVLTPEPFDPRRRTCIGREVICSEISA
ncbi:MAG TPA: nucleotidyltransferase [Spirochaetaceae bacterium]|nr:nucleotidyltransferase [Spirochaetaceae bacterium]HAW85005.1 nucleotidyltransferase [Spirochaetaceae bacterium]HAX36949.1 nucleotidyltransferase [Spirochaetaceae bacterium]HCQ86649.1 nucleotidyltransferase [Spirochaetaceae bacterium]